jgi:hypothetical protein
MFINNKILKISDIKKYPEDKTIGILGDLAISYKNTYKHLKEENRRLMAIEDMQNSIGTENFEVLNDIAMRVNHYYQLAFIALFEGIQGYPVKALWDETRQEMKDMTT